ncbi:MAG: SIR2 family NAD-dependent protein deacylase [Rhizobiaceae bacterium]
MEIVREKTRRLTDLIGNSSAILLFTGAGISPESGIADFRSPGGIWSKIKPIQFSAFVADPQVRLEDWQRRFHFKAEFDKALPNEGHRAVTDIVNGDSGLAVITQNIDGLHQRSGIRDSEIIEIHGNGTKAACLDCEAPMTLDRAKQVVENTGVAPVCERCGGIVKACVVSFGQPMPADKMLQAEQLSLACDLFVVLGSSLVVQPAATLPVVACNNGARLVIVNREPTPLDSIAELVIHAPIGETMRSTLLP